MEPQSVDIIKGWTRSTVVATFLVAAAEIDLNDSTAAEVLKPLYPLLDRCWLLPVHVACQQVMGRRNCCQQENNCK